MVALLEVKTVESGAAIDSGEQETITRYQYTNHLDSASLELDENADVISYEEYQPFGTTSYSMHTNDSEVSAKRYRYVHKELDTESGLCYYGARYYAAWTCKFISVDPLAGKYSFQTPYANADNNPILKNDPTGMGTEDGDGGSDDSGKTMAEKQTNHQISSSEVLGKKVTTFSHINIKLIHNTNDNSYTITKDLIETSFEFNKDGSISSSSRITNLSTQTFEVNFNSTEQTQNGIKDALTSLSSTVPMFSFAEVATEHFGSMLKSNYTVNTWTSYTGETRTWYGTKYYTFLGSKAPALYKVGNGLNKLSKGFSYGSYALTGLSLVITGYDYLYNDPKMGLGFGGNREMEVMSDVGFTGVSLASGGVPGMIISHFYSSYKAVAKAKTFEERYNVGTAHSISSRGMDAARDSNRKLEAKQNQLNFENYLKSYFQDL